MHFKRLYSSLPKLPPLQDGFIPKKYDGISYKKMVELRSKHINPAIKHIYAKPLALHQGYMQWLFDIDGKRYLDLIGGICTVSVGHCHPYINEAIKKQINDLHHVTNLYLHPKLYEYAERLTDKLPGDLKVVYIVNSGSEANDLAIMMSRLHTKNFNILSFNNAYHGGTCQVMALLGNNAYRYSTPAAPGIYQVMHPDVYQGLWGGNKCRDGPVQTARSCNCQANKCEAKDKYMAQIKDVFKYTIPKNTLAAFIAESIQGVGGTVQYPKGYIKELAELVRSNGGLFVADEVQTGFGRTGDHFWGFEGHDIVPDIVTMAKSIGNGFPLAAVVTTPQIAACMSQALHFNTFGGNPISCAVGTAVLDVIEKEELQENCKNLGTYFLLELHKMQNEFDFIGDVRGKGFMIGIELIKGGGDKSPIDMNKLNTFFEYVREEGILIGKGGISGTTLRLKPPMCITKEDVDFTLKVFRDGFKQIS